MISFAFFFFFFFFSSSVELGRGGGMKYPVLISAYHIDLSQDIVNKYFFVGREQKSNCILISFHNKS